MVVRIGSAMIAARVAGLWMRLVYPEASFVVEQPG